MAHVRETDQNAHDQAEVHEKKKKNDRTSLKLQSFAYCVDDDDDDDAG